MSAYLTPAQLREWERTQPRWHSVMRDGYPIPWLGGLRPPPFAMANYASAYQHRAAVSSEIERAVRAGKVEACATRPAVVNPLVVVIKERHGISKTRVCLDFSLHVNTLIPHQSVQYCSIDDAIAHLGPGYYMAKVDLKDGYWHIPIAPADRDALGFEWQGVYYRFNYLPFGLSLACALFQDVTSSIAEHLRALGVTLLVYIDDFLVIGPTAAACQHGYDLLLRYISDLGLTANTAKCVPPTQCLEFLGVTLDTVRCEARMPDWRREEVTAMVTAYSRRRVVTGHELRKLCGKLNYAALVVRGGRTFVRRLNAATALLRGTPSQQRRQRITLSADLRGDLLWWRDLLPTFNGVTCWLRRDQRHSLITDASPWGYGGTLDGTAVHGRFAAHQLREHITWKELYTVVHILRRNAPQLAGTAVDIQSDNMATVYCVRKGVSRSPTMMSLLRCMFFVCAQHDISITATHIPGALNTVADAQSRRCYLCRALQPAEDCRHPVCAACRAAHRTLPANAATQLATRHPDLALPTPGPVPFYMAARAPPRSQPATSLLPPMQHSAPSYTGPPPSAGPLPSPTRAPEPCPPGVALPTQSLTLLTLQSPTSSQTVLAPPSPGADMVHKCTPSIPSSESWSHGRQPPTSSSSSSPTSPPSPAAPPPTTPTAPSAATSPPSASCTWIATGLTLPQPVSLSASSSATASCSARAATPSSPSPSTTSAASSSPSTATTPCKSATSPPCSSASSPSCASPSTPCAAPPTPRPSSGATSLCCPPAPCSTSASPRPTRPAREPSCPSVPAVTASAPSRGCASTCTLLSRRRTRPSSYRTRRQRAASSRHRRSLTRRSCRISRLLQQISVLTQLYIRVTLYAAVALRSC